MDCSSRSNRARRTLRAGLLVVVLWGLHGRLCPPRPEPECDRPPRARDPGKPYIDCRSPEKEPYIGFCSWSH